MPSTENLAELRHNLAHLSLPAVRDFYEKAYRDCRLIYNQLPSPTPNADPSSGMEAVVEVEIMKFGVPDINGPEKCSVLTICLWWIRGYYPFGHEKAPEPKTDARPPVPDMWRSSG